MKNELLEQLYEAVILPNYEEIQASKIHWKEHRQIDSDAWIHSFEDESGTEYVVLFEDYPSGLLDNDTRYDLVKSLDREVLRFTLDTPFEYVENVTGYFSLHKKKNP